VAGRCRARRRRRRAWPRRPTAWHRKREGWGQRRSSEAHVPVVGPLSPLADVAR
jgi:hypothetical protein